MHDARCTMHDDAPQHSTACVPGAITVPSVYCSSRNTPTGCVYDTPAGGGSVAPASAPASMISTTDARGPRPEAREPGAQSPTVRLHLRLRPQTPDLRSNQMVAHRAPAFGAATSTGSEASWVQARFKHAAAGAAAGAIHVVVVVSQPSEGASATVETQIALIYCVAPRDDAVRTRTGPWREQTRWVRGGTSIRCYA